MDLKNIVVTASANEQIISSEIKLNHLSINEMQNYKIKESITLIRVIEKMAESSPDMIFHQNYINLQAAV